MPSQVAPANPHQAHRLKNKKQRKNQPPPSAKHSLPTILQKQRMTSATPRIGFSIARISFAKQRNGSAMARMTSAKQRNGFAKPRIGFAIARMTSAKQRIGSAKQRNGFAKATNSKTTLLNS